MKKDFTKEYLKTINVIKEDADETKETPAQNETKVICFKTSDPELIEVLNGKFDSVTFSVTAEDEDEAKEVTIKADSFGDISVEDDSEQTVQEDVEEDDMTTEQDQEDIATQQDEDIEDSEQQVVQQENQEDMTTEQDQEDIATQQDEEMEDEEEIEQCSGKKCNAFESALSRIKRKYMIK